MTTLAKEVKLLGAERRLILLLALIQFTHVMDFMILMPLGPKLMRLFEISPQKFSLLVSGYTISAGLSSFLGSFWLDRVGRRSALIWLYLGFLISTVGCFVVEGFFQLGLARVFAGFFGGQIGTLILMIVGDAVTHERRARATGMVMAGFSLAAVFGVPFGLLLADHFTWNAPFGFLSLISFVVWLGIIKEVPELKSHLASKLRFSVTASLKALGTLLVESNTRSALTIMVLMMLGQFMIIPFLGPSLVFNAGLQERYVPFVYLCGGGVTVFTSPIVGRWADKVGRHRVFRLMALASIAPILAITHLPESPTWLILLVTTAFFVIVNGRMVPFLAILTSAVDPVRRGSFLSLNSSLQQIGAGVASLLAGLIVQKAESGRLLHFGVSGLVASTVSVAAFFLISKVSAVLVHQRPVLNKSE